jgi:hypothetical protein
MVERIPGVRKYLYHTPIVSAEWNGFITNSYGCSLTDFDELYEGLAMQAYTDSSCWGKRISLSVNGEEDLCIK